MDLTTLLKIATTRLNSKRGGISTSDLAFAEVDASGKIESVNPLARMKWGWQNGEMIQDEVRIALEGLAGKKPTELPLTLGGLHVGAIAQDKKAGWLVFGYSPNGGMPLSSVVDGESSTTDAAQPDQVAGADTDEDSRSSATGDAAVVRTSNGIAAGSDLGREKEVQSTLQTLRLLATTSPDHAIFSVSALQAMSRALGAEQVHFLLKNGRGDIVLAASSHAENGCHKSGLVLTDDHPIFKHVEARGTSTHVNRAIAPVICSQVGFADAIVTAVRENSHVTGYVIAVLATRKQGVPPSDHHLKHADQLVAAFGSLHAWISLIARYRNMVSAIEDVVFSFRIGQDAARSYSFLSDRIEAFSGYRPAELTGVAGDECRWIDRIVHEDDRERVRAVTRSLETSDERLLDYRIAHRNGSTRWVREHVWRSSNTVGLLAFTGVIKDISEVKAMEAMVDGARKDAETARSARTAFVATMSHEVRTPLGALSGYAQLLGKELTEYEEASGNQLPEQIHEFANVLMNRSHKLQSLVHDLFDLSNLEMGGAVLKREAIALHAVVRESAARVAPDLERKGVKLVIDLETSDPIVLSDNRCLGQILDNVLSNATKFTEHGSVTVRTRSMDDCAVIEVEDTGIGISEGFHGELFEAFSQEENWRNRRFSGTGLGLALSRRLLDLLDGRIEVDSEKGRGSTFRVLLPLARDQLA